MKKTVFAIILSVILMGNVNAQNINKIELFIPERNASGTKTLNLKNQEALLGKATKYIATTYEYNVFGQITNIYEKEISENESDLIVNNPNIHVLSDGELHDLSKENPLKSNHYEYETNSKKIELIYGTRSGNVNFIQFKNSWKTSPSKRSHDILAVRFTNSVSASSYTVSGTQAAYAATTITYTESSSSDHMQKFLNGAGLSMNLYDNYNPAYELLNIESTSNFGTYVYATYQHATQNISLTNSKSYTMSSSGLGEVLNHTYASSYDGMQGVYSEKT